MINITIFQHLFSICILTLYFSGCILSFVINLVNKSFVGQVHLAPFYLPRHTPLRCPSDDSFSFCPDNWSLFHICATIAQVKHYIPICESITQGVIVMNQKVKGVCYITCTAFCFNLMNVFVRLAGDIPSIQKSFFRICHALF